MTCHDLDWLVKVVSDAFPLDDDQVSKGVHVVALVVNHLTNPAQFGARFGRMQSEDPTDDGGEQKDQTHHDGPWTHAPASYGSALSIPTI
jgi:hypothetical protein